MHKDQPVNLETLIHAGVVAVFCLVCSACTSQQYYEGLKAGHQSQCLEYPESEYNDCIEETNTGFEQYQNQRKEVIGN